MAAKSGGRSSDVCKEWFTFTLVIEPLLQLDDDSSLISEEDDPERFQQVEKCFKENFSVLQECFNSLECGQPVNLDKNLTLTWAVASVAEFENLKKAVQKKLIQKELCEFLKVKGILLALEIPGGDRCPFIVDIQWNHNRIASDVKRCFNPKGTKRESSQTQKGTKDGQADGSNTKQRQGESPAVGSVPVASQEKKNAVSSPQPSSTDVTKKDASAVDKRAEKEVEAFSKSRAAPEVAKPNSHPEQRETPNLQTQCQRQPTASLGATSAPDSGPREGATAFMLYTPSPTKKMVTFRVWISPSCCDGKEIETVAVVQKIGSNVKYTRMTQLGKDSNLWEVKIEFVTRFTYHYAVKVKKWYHWWTFEWLKETLWRVCDTPGENYDLFLKKSDDSNEVQDGCITHILTLVKSTHLNCVQSISKSISCCLQKNVMTNQLMTELLKRLPWNLRESELLAVALVLVLSPRIENFLTSDSVRNFFSGSEALWLLKNLDTLPQDLLHCCQERLSVLVEHLCACAFKTKHCFLVYLYRCLLLPAMKNEGLQIKLLENNISGKGWTIPLVSTSLTEEETSKLFTDVCQNLCGTKRSPPFGLLLEKICMFFPIDLVFNAEAVFNQGFGENSFQKVLYARLERSFQEAMKMKNLFELNRLMHHMQGMSTDVSEFAARIKEILSVILKNSSTSSEKVEIKSLIHIFQSSLLVDADFAENVLALLSRSFNKDLHLFFLDLLGSTFAEQVCLPKLQSFVTLWMTTAIKHHCLSRSSSVDHCVPAPYYYFHLASQVPVLQREVIMQCLSNTVYSEYARKFTLNEFLKMACATFWKDIAQEDIVVSHLAHLLEDNQGMATPLKSVADWLGDLYIRKRIHAKVLCLCIARTGIQQCQAEEELILLIMTHSLFWIKMARAYGSYGAEVREHEDYKKVMIALKSIGQQIADRRASCWFTRQIENREKEVDELLTKTVRCEGILNALQQNQLTLSKASKAIEGIEQVLKSIPEERFKKCNFEQLAEHVRMKRSELDYGKKLLVYQVDSERGSFWQSLFGLQDVYEPLISLGMSELFWFLSEQYLAADSDGEGAVLEGDDGDASLSDIRCLLDEVTVEPLEMSIGMIKTLASTGVQKYKQIWMPLFEGRNVTLGEISDILSMRDIAKETEIAVGYLSRTMPKESSEGLSLYEKHSKYQKNLDSARNTLRALGYDGKNDPAYQGAVDAFDNLSRTGSLSDLHLHDLAMTKTTLQPLQDMIKGEFTDVLAELACGQGLIEFLRSVVKEDLRNWIDAVEDHSEQYVQESTVSNLIEVRRYLHQVLQDDLSKMTVAEIFHTLSKAMTGFTDLPKKINDCTQHLHGLITLLNNMANRGEATKQIVSRTVRQQGAKFLFHMKTGHCDCQLQYTTTSEEKKKTHVIMKMEDVLDLRSRVLLLMNTEGKSGSRPKGVDELRSDYSRFVDYVDDAMQIADMYHSLWELAHPDFHPTISDVKLDTASLKSKLQRLTCNRDEWEEELRHCRSNFYELNFFFPDQLWKIFQFLKNEEDRDEVLAMLQFAGYDSAAVNKMQDFFDELTPATMKLEAFRLIGQAMHKASEYIEFSPARFPIECLAYSKLSKLTDTVEQGQLFIAALDENSMQVIPTLLTLYHNTTGTLPLPHQVLFCREDTTWEEIQLLLLRCAGADTTKEQALFCLVHVEKLTNKLQFKLVEELVKFCRKDFSYLAVICRGSIRHPFIDHFSEVVHHVQPMSFKALELCFQSLWPEVEVVTSELPGQGKTEVIRQMAHEDEHEYACLHVSGDFSQRAIVETLANLNLTPQHLIHIDLGSLSDPLQLDSLVFQMVILKCLRYRTELCLIPTKHVKIEVANTINNVLLNSLKTTLLFSRKKLCWNNFTDFKFSMEICSSEQVLCHYLKASDCSQIGKIDLFFTGKSARKPLPLDECRRILQKQFNSATDLSFSAVQLFLNILADQLKKLSCSSFMSVACLAEMAGDDKVASIRTAFVGALVDVAEEFSSRSVQACRTDQAAAISLTAEGTSKEEFLRGQLMATEASATAMTGRVDSMIRWSDSNHLVIVFHNQDIQTLSALYRDLRLVPPHVRELFETQIKKKLPDFASIDQNQLQQIVQRVARFSPDPLPETELVRLNSSYALTPDNVLKMILITLRVKANIPVIIMGETGCGKTSLIRYLAAICGVEFKVMNVHAGTLDSDIVDFVWGAHTEGVKTLTKQIWVFLDEINTCKHMGLINEVLCHHQCLGRPLSPNLVLMAACNPYKLRNQTSIHTAGLESKVKVDEQSKLVYRVHPLPESMVDYVWDYGTLSSGAGNSDESAYIARMVSVVLEAKTDMLVDALVASQNFIREVEQNDFCVSLRDVNRFRILFKWFVESLRMKLKGTISSQDCQRNAVILAFAHVYHCRLPNNEKRRQYRTELAQIFSRHGWTDLRQDGIQEIIHAEQQDLLDRMEVPEGTARNTALQENVFVVLNCILNRMPVFLVGKPGCSKSLSLQLIKSNLRGKDSRNEYFQSLPQLYFVSYQGSESSTSEGILKVFEKARKYRESNKQEDVLPVVILDEIGLAEVSRFNPLKVLHSLLEPGEQELPDVAVVGVSNWALDAAKMNRAIHLSRPDMDREELFQTGISISKACMQDTSTTLLIGQAQKRVNPVSRDLLQAIANAYDEYRIKQTISNFHGLRDYYSLVKYISRARSNPQSRSVHVLVEGLLRNFGGVPEGFATLMSIFQNHLKETTRELDREMKVHNVLELVNQNLNDKLARHLLLITRGDVALSILEAHLKAKEQKRSYATILGSRFEEDLTDDYNYRIISRIILHMEQGVILILRDLESIYGSLYDMLNQNYTIIGTKRNCRIALGPYSNPLCQVHEDFRCIVLIEEQKLDLSDPPFLNRFEKQRLTLQDVLDEEQKVLASEVESWLLSMSDLEKTSFKIKDLLPVYGTDLVPSLVHHVCTVASQRTREEKLKMCEDYLLQLFTPDGVLRAESSRFAKAAHAQMQDVHKRYFALPLHDGLSHYVRDLVSHTEGSVKSIIVTHSNPHTDIASCMRTVSESCQVERLGALKSEKQLSLRSELFWTDPDKEWLIFQCSVTTDMANFLLLKTTLEKHSQQHSAETLGSRKNVMIILHLDRSQKSSMLEVINYLMGWQLAFLDVLEDADCKLQDFLDKTALQLILERDSVAHFVKRQLFWAFTRIDYTACKRTILSLEEIMKAIVHNSELLGYVMDTIVLWLKQNDKATDPNWSMDVACNVAALQSCSTLSSALERELQKYIEHPLAAVVFQLEKANAWDSLRMDHLEEKKKDLWLQFARDRSIVDISQVEAPMGPECYQCHTPLHCLRHPFSRILFNRIESLKECALATKHTRLNEVDHDDFDPLPKGFVDEMCTQYHSRICQRGGDMIEETYYDQQMQNYLHDFAAIVLGPSAFVQADVCLWILQWLLMKYVGDLDSLSFADFVVRLHCSYWLQEALIQTEFELLSTCFTVTKVTGDQTMQCISELFDCLTLSEAEKETDGSSDVQHAVSPSEEDVRENTMLMSPRFPVKEMNTSFPESDVSNNELSGDPEPKGDDVSPESTPVSLLPQDESDGRERSSDYQFLSDSNEEAQYSRASLSGDEPNQNFSGVLNSDDIHLAPSDSSEVSEPHSDSASDSREDEDMPTWSPHDSATSTEQQNLNALDVSILETTHSCQLQGQVAEGGAGIMAQTFEERRNLNIFEPEASDHIVTPTEDFPPDHDDEMRSNAEEPVPDHLSHMKKELHMTEDATSLSGLELDTSATCQSELASNSIAEHLFNIPPDDSNRMLHRKGSSLALNENLANIACQRLIPSESLFKDEDMTIESWQHTVSSVLSLQKKISLASSKVSISPAVSQGLQVALDFASCLKSFLGNLHQQRDYLTELGQRLAEDGVLSRGVFDYLLQLFADPTFRETHAREALSHYFASYVINCLRVNDDSDNVAAFCWSLDALSKDENMMDHVKFFGPPIHCALLMEVEPCMEEIKELFTCDEMIQDSDLLTKLNECLLAGDEGSFRIMCLCVDVVEHFFLCDMTVSAQDPNFLDLLHDCAACIRSGDFSLKMIVAVALLRKSMALMVDKMRSAKTLSSAEQTVVQRTDKILTSFSSEEKSTKMNPLQKHFIRLLLQGDGMKTLKRLTAHLKNYCSFLSLIPLDDASCLNSLDFQLQMSEHRTANICEALLDKKKAKTEMQQVLRDAGGDGDTAYSVLAVASEHFYLVKSIRPLSDSETSQISALSESCRNLSLPENLSFFIDFLSSEGSVKHLVLTETVGEEGFQLAAFIVHLACKVVAFNLTTACPDSAASFWVKCLQSPETLSNCFLPAAPDTADGFRPLGFLPCMSTAGQVTFAKCRCGARTATTASSSEELKCLSCKDFSMAADRWDKRSSVSSEPIAVKDFLKGFFFPDLDKLKDSALAVRQLSPCAFRVLQLMIHGCLLGSVAMNFITRENLQRLLRLPGDEDVTDVLYKHLETHWEVLASLTSLGHAQLGRLLHLIIDRCLDTTTPKANELLELETRENVEVAWCREIDHQILHRFPFLKDRIEKFKEEKATGGITALENFTEETGSCSEECIALLFRETLRPSISNLKAEYSLQTQAQTTHPFIGLVLSKEVQLGLLCCLHPILSWHLLTVRMISYHMKKDETKKLKVHEYIHSFQEQDRKKMVQERFDAFKKAWNELCGHWEHLRPYHKTLRELEKISNQSRLDECLAMESSSVILQVLKALVEMHNEFLDDAVILSLRLDTPSLGFLKKNDTLSCIKGIPLELVSRKQLFELRLSDLPTSEMRFSQNCTEFGLGRILEYNFFKYEIKWAEELLLDAPYLTMGLSFPQVVLSGELIQRSASLLHDVHDILPQCDLDREMKKSVHALRERNPTNLRSLLESLEMVMSLLKKTSGQGSQDADSASQYLEQWAYLLTPPPDAIMGFLKHVTLPQITGLFEFVEGLQAAMIGETLPDQYRSDLPAEARDSLDEAVSTSSLQELELLLLALQKFALRYLSSPGTDLDDLLCHYLQDPSLWPRSCLGDDNHCGAMDLVPPQLYMEHIHALIAYMDGAISEKKRQMEKTWVSGSASSS